jgi:mannose/fructose/N-acetylgalactosamine-specific phosphotransferase system component IIC
VGFAFVCMGGWALFANRTHGWGALAPGLAQGTMSGLITLVLKHALEAMSRRVRGPAAYLAPPLVSASTILTLLIVVHGLIGTPEIAATIAVPWSVSTLYAIVYAATLARGRKQAEADAG